MAEARYFCPDCGSVDLIITGEVVKNVECPNCGWKGPINETLGLATTEKIWDIERIGSVMLRTMAVHAAGPLVQALEFIGLLQKKIVLQNSTETAEHVRQVLWNKEVQRSRDSVMQRICEAAITAGFNEAERQNRRFAEVMGTNIHPIFAAEDSKHADKIRNRKQRKRR